MTRRFLALVVVVMATIPVAGQTSTARTALEAARKVELIDGNLDAAIAQYKAIVSRFGRTDREVAAQALLRMAGCYEQRGTAQARSVYEQVVRDYADQSAAVVEARARLRVGHQEAIPTPRRLEVAGLNFAYGSVSDDGRWLVGTDPSRRQLVSRDLNAGTNYVLKGQPSEPGAAPILNTVLSPDGKRVAYTFRRELDDDNGTETFELRVLATDGTSAPVTLLRGDDNDAEIFEIWPWAWSPDGKRILTEISRRDETWQLLWVTVADKSFEPLKSLEWRRQLPLSRMKVSLSPDARYVAYSALVTNPKSAKDMTQDASDKHVYILAADGSAETELTTVPGRAEMPMWTPDGSHLLVTSGEMLWAVPMSSGKPSGTPIVVKDGVGDSEPLVVTRAGSLYYRSPPSSVGWLTVRELESAPAPLRNTNSATFAIGGFGPVWSPRGDAIAYERSPTLRVPATVVIRTLDTGAEKTFPGVRAPQWYPDGRHLLVAIDARLAPNGVMYCCAAMLSTARIDVDSGTITTLPIASRREGNASSQVLSPDGNTLYRFERTDGRIVAFDLATGQGRDVHTLDKTQLNGPKTLAVSPDGRSIAVATVAPSPIAPARENAILTVAVDGSAARGIASLSDPITDIAWRTDGLVAATRSGDGQRRVVRIDVESGAMAPVIVGDLSGFSGSFGSLSPDRSRMAIRVTSGLTNAHELWALDHLESLLKTSR
jgi:Tol biopolymer transport system component